MLYDTCQRVGFPAVYEVDQSFRPRPVAAFEIIAPKSIHSTTQSSGLVPQSFTKVQHNSRLRESITISKGTQLIAMFYDKKYLLIPFNGES